MYRAGQKLSLNFKKLQIVQTVLPTKEINPGHSPCMQLVVYAVVDEKTNLTLAKHDWDQ